jgi:hypothetical protein
VGPQNTVCLAHDERSGVVKDIQFSARLSRNSRSGDWADPEGLATVRSASPAAVECARSEARAAHSCWV